jgi:hypothetical protein
VNVATKQLPRGIRNNNPGNIRRSKDPWQGLAEKQTDPAFFIFETAPFGIRALARVLITYYDKHKLTKVKQIINRWAPETENNTAAYISNVCESMGVEPHTVIDLHDYNYLKPLVVAIIAHENSNYAYSDAVVDKGLALAGVVPEKPKSLQKSRTVKGAQVAGGATVLSMVTEAVRQAEPAIPMIQAALQYAPWVVAMLALAGIGLVVWAKLDDRNRGIA